MKKNIIVGIDIGKTGAISLIDRENLNLICAINYSEQGLTGIINILKKYKDNIYKVYIENVHSMPKQGVKSVFSFGERKGEIVGILETISLTYDFITPQSWKNYFSLLKTDKKIAIELCYNICNFKEYVESKKIRKTYLSGIADSYLIGLYGCSKESNSGKLQEILTSSLNFAKISQDERKERK